MIRFQLVLNVLLCTLLYRSDAGDVPLGCVTREGNAARGADAYSKVKCRAGETMVSCGIKGVQHVGGAWIEGDICSAVDYHNAYNTFAEAVCCTFPRGAVTAVTTVKAKQSPDGGLSKAVCPKNAVLTGCQVKYSSGGKNRIQGSFTGPSSPRTPQTTKYIATQNTCNAWAKGGSTVEGSAQCLQISDKYELQCQTMAKLTKTDRFGTCPRGYNMFGCNTYTTSASLDGWYVTPQKKCYVQQDNHRAQYANAICCKLTTKPPPPLECPKGSVQVGRHNADIGGCGLERCDQRYDKANIEECEDHCRKHPRCRGYNWAPLGGDRNHRDKRTCTIYDRSSPTSYWAPNQIFCRPTCNGVACDDNNPCTQDRCENGKCVFDNVDGDNSDCEDGDSCTQNLCSNGKCMNPPMDCNDDNACTADSCDSGVCSNEQKVCSDDDQCTQDLCNPADGQCYFPPTEIATQCTDDGEDCNGITACNTANGECETSDPMDCDDGDACTIDSCLNSKCLNAAKDCSDGDACTQDICTEGVCSNPDTEVAAACDNGLACDGQETCNQNTGQCEKGEPVVCEDKDACTENVCNEEDGSCTYPATLAAQNCGDGDMCNGIEMCNKDSGACDPGEEVVCPWSKKCRKGNGKCYPDCGVFDIDAYFGTCSAIPEKNAKKLALINRKIDANRKGITANDNKIKRQAARITGNDNDIKNSNKAINQNKLNVAKNAKDIATIRKQRTLHVRQYKASIRKLNKRIDRLFIQDNGIYGRGFGRGRKKPPLKRRKKRASAVLLDFFDTDEDSFIIALLILNLFVIAAFMVYCCVQQKKSKKFVYHGVESIYTTDDEKPLKEEESI